MGTEKRAGNVWGSTACKRWEMQDCRMRRFEGREERNKHVEDKQARPQDNFWAQFKGKILRMWSQCLTQLLYDLLFHHPGHSLE